MREWMYVQGPIRDLLHIKYRVSMWTVAAGVVHAAAP